MKYYITILSLVLITSCVKKDSFNKSCTNSNVNLIASNTELEYSKNILIIFFDTKVGNQYLLQAIEELNAEVIYHYSTMNGMAIKISKSKNLDKYISYLKNVKGVLSVNKDYVIKID